MLFRVIAVILVFLLLMSVLAAVLKVVFVVAFLAALVITALFAISLFRTILFGPASKSTPATDTECKLVCTEGSVPLYREEPSVKQLVDQGQADQEPADKILLIASDTPVKVLETSEVAVKVKVRSGQQKGSIGWVDKALVAGYEPPPGHK